LTADTYVTGAGTLQSSMRLGIGVLVPLTLGMTASIAIADEEPSTAEPSAVPAASVAPVASAASATPTGPATTTAPKTAPKSLAEARRYRLPPPATSTAGPSRDWYGWQTLIADVGSFGVATATVYGGGRTLTVAVGLYFLGAPIVHFAHGNLVGFGSIGLRLAGAVAAGLSVLSMGWGGSSSDGIVVLAASAILVPPIIDASVLAYGEEKPRDAKTSLLPSVTPWVTKSVTGLSATGTF
jgi:hypothetical protein